MSEGVVKMGGMADGVWVSEILRFGGSRANSVMLMGWAFWGFRVGAGVVRLGRSVLFLGGLAQMHLENCIVSGFQMGSPEIHQNPF
jgi:hypothetical protein